MKKRKQFDLSKLSNRTLYSLISVFILITVAVVVYAVAPNPGHTLSQIEMPSCTAGQVLEYSGSAWVCGTDDVGSGGTSQWTTSGTSIYYNGGNVGIGTSTPGYKLDVSTIAKVGNGLVVGNDQGYLYSSAAGNVTLKTGTSGGTARYSTFDSSGYFKPSNGIILGGVARTTWPGTSTSDTITAGTINLNGVSKTSWPAGFEYKFARCTWSETSNNAISITTASQCTPSCGSGWTLKSSEVTYYKSTYTGFGIQYSKEQIVLGLCQK